jgi:hypothetical protein
MTVPINLRIKWGWLPDGYEIISEDVGEPLDVLYFGQVQRSDVGRKVYIRNGQTCLGSSEQVVKRRGYTIYC